MNELLLLVLLLLQALDGLSTYRIISEGKGYEANPVVAKILDSLGLVPGLVVSKVVASAACLLFYYYESPFIMICIGAVYDR
jgi:hypothetical protein